MCRLRLRLVQVRPAMASEVPSAGGRWELASDAELKTRFAFRIAACWGAQEDDSPAWMYSQDLPVDIGPATPVVKCCALLTVRPCARTTAGVV